MTVFTGAMFSSTGNYDASFYLGGCLFLLGTLLHFALFLPCFKVSLLKQLVVLYLTYCTLSIKLNDPCKANLYDKERNIMFFAQEGLFNSLKFETVQSSSIIKSICGVLTLITIYQSKKIKNKQH